MEIIVADPCGFCYGVKRAVEIAEGAVHNLPAATLGPLIHNPGFIEELRQRGVETVSAPEETPPGVTLFIRTHEI